MGLACNHLCIFMYDVSRIYYIYTSYTYVYIIDVYINPVCTYIYTLEYIVCCILPPVFYICISFSIYILVYTYIYIHACVGYVYICIYIYTYVYTYQYMYVHTYIYICIYIYFYFDLHRVDSQGSQTDTK